MKKEDEAPVQEPETTQQDEVIEAEIIPTEPIEPEELTEEQKNEQAIVIANRRSDWRKVHHKIQRAIVSYYNDNKTFPTYREIAKLTGLDLSSVFRHMQELDVNVIVNENLQNIRMMGDQLFMAIYQTALKGNTTAQQMLLNGAFGFAMSANVPNAGPGMIQQNNFFGGGAYKTPNGMGAQSEPLEPEQVADVNTTLDNLIQIAEYRKKRELPSNA